MSNPDFIDPNEGLADEIDAALEDLWRGRPDGIARIMSPEGPPGSLADLIQGAAMDPSLEVHTEVPARIGAYEIVREMGRGGMGVVYEARQATPKRSVALKVILGGRYAEQSRTKLFRREIDTLARLKHPYIAAIYEAGRTEDRHDFYTMELVNGHDLLAHAAAGGPAPLAIRDRVVLVQKICSAISYAHRRGVIHRDLKPTNIVIEQDGTPKVLDFGLARVIGREADGGSTMLTVTGRVVGTLPYMSPEQARGAADEVDVRSDVYSIGVMLFELVTGRMPYAVGKSSPVDAVRVICETPPTRPGQLNGAARGDLETIILKALEKEPDRRYQTADAFADDLDRYLRGDMIKARPATAIYQLKKFARRNRVLVTSVCVVIVSLVLGVVGTSVQAIRAMKAEREANEQRKLAEEALSASKRETKRLRAANEFYLKNILEAAFPWRMGPAVTVLDAIKHAEPQIGEEFSDSPETEALLRHYVGNIFQTLERYGEADSQLKRSSELWHQQLGDEENDTLTTDIWRVRLLRKLGRWAEAESLASTVLDASMHAKQKPGWRVPEAEMELAIVFQETGRFDQAEALMRRSLASAEAYFSPFEYGATMRREQLALLLIEMGRPDESHALYRELLDAAEKKCGGDCDDALTAQGFFAVSFQRLGKFDESAASWQQVIRSLELRAVRPMERIAWTRGKLAQVLASTGSEVKLDSAVELRADLLEAAKRRTGNESVESLAASEAYIRALIDAGRIIEAEDLAATAVRIEEELNKSGSIDLPRIPTLLVESLRLQGKVIEALPIAREDFDRRRQNRGLIDGATLRGLFELAGVLDVTSDSKERMKILDEHLGAVRREYGDSSPAVMETVQALGQYELDHNRYDSALARFQNALDICLANYGEYFTRTLTLRELTIKTLRLAGKISEADRMAREAVENMKLRYGEEHPWTRRYQLATLPLLRTPADD